MLSDTSPLRPSAYTRVPGLEVVQVPDGYVVYDDERNLVHYLNPSAAMVLELCEVCVDAAAIARRMRELFELPDHPDVDVDSCLSQLLDQGLILHSQGAELRPA